MIVRVIEFAFPIYVHYNPNNRPDYDEKEGNSKKSVYRNTDLSVGAGIRWQTSLEHV